MTTFFRFPSTPHLTWLGRGPIPREDKSLPQEDVRSLFNGDVVVEEKLDGANIGLSRDRHGFLQIQNRGQYLTAPYTGQFARLEEWLNLHESRLRDVLENRLILFGEWCAARHSISYDKLPDWFLIFDVYDRDAERFWSTGRRDALAARAGLVTTPTLLRGRTNLGAVVQLLSTKSSRYRTGPMEGLVVRRETADWCECRGKIVRDDFVQMLDEHWRRRHIEWNRIDWASR